MRGKLDENMPSRVVQLFMMRGDDVATVRVEQLAGPPDPDVYEAAIKEGRMLVTLDLGFADIRMYQPGTHSGIVVIRSTQQSVSAVERACELLLDADDIADLAGCTVIVQSGGVRVRRP